MKNVLKLSILPIESIFYHLIQCQAKSKKSSIMNIGYIKHKMTQILQQGHSSLFECIL